MFAGKKSMIYV